MTSPPFSLSQSLVQKAGILTAGILCLVVLGWPNSESWNSVEEQSIIGEAKYTRKPVPSGVSLETLPSGPSVGPRVDLNRGTLEDFKRLPGVGVVLAQRIIDYRHTYGRFPTVEALHLVSGIGKARIARLRLLVMVSHDQPHEEVIEALSQAS